MTKIYDKFDLKIFQEIEFNYNISHSEIAKKIKRTKSFVTYRIKKMEENKLIYYLPLIDYSKLGLSYYRIFIEIPLSLAEIKKKIENFKLSTVWIVERFDKENFVFVILAKNAIELQNIWEIIQEILNKDIISKNISIAYKIHHLSSNFFYDKNIHKKSFITGAEKEEEITENQKHIIDLLSKEPKISYKEISKKTAINEQAVKKSIRILEDKKVILAYQTFLDRKTLGLQFYKAFISFEFSKKNKMQLIKILKDNPNIVYITESSYEYDIECEILVPNEENIEFIIHEIRNKFFLKRIVLSKTKDEIKLI